MTVSGGGKTLRVRDHRRYEQFVNSGAPLVARDVVDAWSTACSYRSVHLEVGSGRGAFLSQLAATHRETFYIGMDYIPFVVAQAATYAVDKALRNVRFLAADIENVYSNFQPHSVDVIYLNFSDPWPKRRQADRRLTAPRKLGIYAQLLKPGGELQMKTDNTELLEWSLHSFQASNWKVIDLDRSVPDERPLDETNPTAKFTQTEYERRFRARGVPIAYLSARAPIDVHDLTPTKESSN